MIFGIEEDIFKKYFKKRLFRNVFYCYLYTSSGHRDKYIIRNGNIYERRFGNISYTDCVSMGNFNSYVINNERYIKQNNIEVERIKEDCVRARELLNEKQSGQISVAEPTEDGKLSIC